MSYTTEMQFPSATELIIVPFPQRDAWAVVNREGDILAVGDYDDCLHHLRQLTATAA